MTYFKEYKDIFGKPGEGAHKYRICDIAIVDVVVMIILACIIGVLTKYNVGYITITLFMLGVVSHRLFGVRTTIDKLLF